AGSSRSHPRRRASPSGGRPDRSTRLDPAASGTAAASRIRFPARPFSSAQRRRYPSGKRPIRRGRPPSMGGRTMSRTTILSGDYLILGGISWKQYLALGKVLGDHTVRMTYLDGRLEIVSPSAEHESAKEKFASVFRLLARALDLPFAGFGSTTFRRRRKRAGKEPDTCFYVRDNARRMWGKQRVNLRVDPPPDLAVEVVV